jgi:anaerobic selenocysteine-containing dehydrogenase
MATERVVRSACALCKSCCGVLIRVAGDKVVGIEGDPENPINRGQLCIKGEASLEYLYSPDRLKHPLRRVGQRGEGKWEQISWDEALNAVAEAFTQAKDKYGAESVLIAKGMAKGPEDDLTMRFANVFGTPNVGTPTLVCYVPTMAAAMLTYGLSPGLTPLMDYGGSPACILVWASNPEETSPPEYWDTNRALDKGTRLAVIDPRRIELAKRADIWVQPRPGSDLALALGMMNVIVNEGLWDKDFVDNWTVGFDELKNHVQAYPPEKVAEITWVDAEKIREVARFFATNKPACIRWGNGLEHNINSFQASRAVWILVAITGNFGVPGGNVPFISPGLLPRGSPEYTLSNRMPADVININLSAKAGMLPVTNHLVHGDIIKSLIEGDPYPIRVAFFQTNNPLVGYFNAREVYEALKKLEVIILADMFMTPTAALADIVLPVATYLEYDAVSAPPNLGVPQIQQKVAQVGESWSDVKIFIELAKKLGLGKDFWENEEQYWDAVLKPIGMTFEELKKAGIIPSSPLYGGYEDVFKTPSGKVEIYSNRLKDWGFDPLPVYYELPETPYSDPALAEEYPLIFTSRKLAPYRGSAGRQIPSLRASHPEPVIDINPETAGKLGIKEGNWVYIETKRGRITQKARLSTDIDPRVVFVDYDWWFPEASLSTLYDWDKSNINIMTSNDLPRNREFGTPTIRSILCKVYPVEG